uniref:PRE_C2HC domain-containing protein n=1 Tax=Panagrellus redivivus TaxID=6233 RepID=A0A7E4W8X7_PANRE
MLDINPKLLLKFFLAQSDWFILRLHLRIHKPDAEIRKKLDALLSNNFKLDLEYIPYEQPLNGPKTRFLLIIYPGQGKKNERYRLRKQK